MASVTVKTLYDTQKVVVRNASLEVKSREKTEREAEEDERLTIRCRV